MVTEIMQNQIVAKATRSLLET